MKPLYVTVFDTKTKKCVGPSQPLGVYIPNRAAAKTMFGGKPDSETPHTMIFNQPNGQALCVSWIRFAI